ncbi:MAG: MBL fold metallo-hydrolase [Candidatus Bathyarchaeota archaeon]
MLEKHDARLRGISLLTGEERHANLFSSNVFVIGNKAITLIDAGDGCEGNRLEPAFQRLNLDIRNIVKVVVTHTHDDHWGGLMELLQTIPLTVLVYSGDIEYYREELSYLKKGNEFKIMGLDEGDLVETENHTLKVLHTPGHDGGSICLYDANCKILFSGDTVFASGTTGSARSGNLNDLKKSLKRLTSIDVDIMLPGHGDIAYEKANEAIKLALERMAWNEGANKNIPSWMKINKE